jgi:chromosome segregation ATPase
MGLFKLGDSFLAGKKGQAASASDALDIKNAREYVSSMSDVIQSGAEQHKKAQQRVNSLSKSISKMESKLRQLGRVEEENKALQSRATAAEKSLALKKAQAAELENELASLRIQLKTAQEELLALRTENTVRKDRDNQNDSQITRQKNEITAMATAITSLEDRQHELSCLNSTLQKDLSEALNDLSARGRSIHELQKNLDDARAKMDVFRKSADGGEIEIGRLQASFEEMKTKFIEANAGRETAEYEATVAKAEFEGRLKRRDEELLTHKNRISQFEAEVRIKEGARAQAERDIADLQHRFSSAIARADKADARAREKVLEADVNAENALKAKAEFDTLNEKYMAALDDIEMLKKINLAQKDKLMRYAAVEADPDQAPAPASGAEALGFEVLDVEPPSSLGRFCFSYIASF